MGLDSTWHWLILLALVLVVFGTGKLAKMGPDLGNALRGFKRALNAGDADADASHAAAKGAPAPVVGAAAEVDAASSTPDK